jgi:hypothetical protein
MWIFRLCFYDWFCPLKKEETSPIFLGVAITLFILFWTKKSVKDLKKYILQNLELDDIMLRYFYSLNFCYTADKPNMSGVGVGVGVGGGGVRLDSYCALCLYGIHKYIHVVHMSSARCMP